MDLESFRAKLESGMVATVYGSQYNGFWGWKIEVEASGREHILDERRKNDAARKLLDILPGWQTYRGVDCDYYTWLPISLSNIAEAYNEIRDWTLLDFDKMPLEPLELIWHELGRVKTTSGKRNGLGEYYVIAVCKPLMFLWGQTPAFDSVNRDELYISHGASWCFEWWVDELKDLQKKLVKDPAIVAYCRQKALGIYGPNYVVPYGRFLDIYYYSKYRKCT
jgi:hypothetical protein